MTKTIRGAFVAGLLLVATAAYAHHRIEAEFNPAQPIMVKGTITKISWSNPHVQFFMDVKDQSGSVTNWGFEMGSPNQQFLRGWKIDSLKQGDVVVVDAYPARNGSHLGYAQKVAKATP